MWFVFCSFQNSGLYSWKTNYGKEKNWRELRNRTFHLPDKGNLNQCERNPFTEWRVNKSFKICIPFILVEGTHGSVSECRWSSEELFRGLVLSFLHASSGIQLQLGWQAWLESHYVLILAIFSNKISFMIKRQNTVYSCFEVENNWHFPRWMSQVCINLLQTTYVYQNLLTMIHVNISILPGKLH